MPIVKKIFVGGVNQDDSGYVMDPKEYLGALNMRFATSENGEVGAVSNVEGNTLKNQTIDSTGAEVAWTLPAGVNNTIGAYEDPIKKRVFFFNYNSNGYHAIYCYDFVEDVVYTVLRQNNNTTLLNFSQDYLIHSVSMSGNILYWTDGSNKPKRVNVEAGIKMNHPTYSTDVDKYEAFQLEITNGGSGYVSGVYQNVPLTGGNGTGAKANITVVGGIVTKVELVYGGTYYDAGNTLSASNTNLGGTGSGLVITITKIFDESVITVVRNQPLYPLTVAKAIDSGYDGAFTGSEAMQFAYRFEYRDGELSALSEYSKLINYNTTDEDTSGYNAVTVTVPTTQWMEQDVDKIHFLVKYINGGKVFSFKTISDASQIFAHNTGTTITFKFYNDVIGAAVDDATATKMFDSVPIKSGTLDVVKNRLFLGNNTIGYDTPSTTSLTVGSQKVTVGAITGQWYLITYRDAGVLKTKYYIRVENITTNPGFYEPASQPSLPLPTTSIANTSLTYIGNTTTAVATSLGVTIYDVISFTYQGVDRPVTGYTSSDLFGKKVFKSDAYYRCGIVFKDASGTRCSVVTKPEISVGTPERVYSGETYVEKIGWSLSNLNAVNEIPDWAKTYSIVMTKCLRTRFFFQHKANSIEYITKDSTGAYQTPTTSYPSNPFGIAVQASNLRSNGLGYAYQEGDLMNLMVSGGSNYTLKVIDTYSDYIIVDAINLGSLSGVNASFEVYTPYTPSDSEFYYEIGETYKVDSAGTPSRSYSTVTGFLTGDVIILKRTISSTDYTFEAMSPADSRWTNWFTDAGRPNFVTETGQVVQKTGLSFSNVVIPGTRTNGLSTFDALDQYLLPVEMGSVQRLVNTSKATSEGGYILAVGERETASVYIGESQIFDQSGASFLAKASGVISNVNVLKGSYGTINPESVFKWQGTVVFFDAMRGDWVTYNVNGLFPISQNKMSKYFKKVGQDVLNYQKDSTEYDYANPTSPLRVIGWVDPFHGEFLHTMPRMFLNPKNTILADMEIGTLTGAFTTALPNLTLTPSSLSGFTYVTGSGPSTGQSFVVTGTSLSANGSVSMACSTSFEVSTNGLDYSCSASLPYSGTTCNLTFYVRLKAGLAASTPSETITVSGGGATAVLSLSGSVTYPITPYIILTPSVIGGFSYVEASGPSTAQTFTIVAGNLSPAADNISIPSTTNYEFSTDGVSYSTAGITIPYTGGTLASTTIYVRLKSGLVAGTYSESVSITGGTATAGLTLSGLVSSDEIVVYTYSAGWGTRTSAACNNYTTAPDDVYAIDSPTSFGVGTVIYTNPAPSTPLTGASKIYANGGVWDIDTVTGVITGYSSTQC